MNTRFYLIRAWLLALVVLFAGQTAAQAQSADQIIKRLKTKYDATQALRAEFTQTMTSPFANGEEQLSGTLVLKGDQYRVETGGQTFVTDGKVTWIYDAAQNQVLINNAGNDEMGFSVNDFFFNYAERYNATDAGAERVGGQLHYRLKMKPKQSDSMLREATLWMRDRDNVITRLEVLDVNDTRMLFELDNIEMNPSINAGTFTFTPPKNAEVIDLRS